MKIKIEQLKFHSPASGRNIRYLLQESDQQEVNIPILPKLFMDIFWKEGDEAVLGCRNTVGKFGQVVILDSIEVDMSEGTWLRQTLVLLFY